jgi:F-type H+-transporting ATPase subunit b
MEGLPLSFDFKIFLFSIVNFGILFFILKKILFMPVYNVLEERKVKIKKGLDQIESAAKEREIVGAEKEKILATAGKESEEIIQQAKKLEKEIISQSRKEAEKIIKLSREDIEKEREDLKREMRVLLMDLVTDAADRALLNISTQENQNNIIERSILQSLQESSIDMYEKRDN